jgi:hypothetical protein
MANFRRLAELGMYPLLAKEVAAAIDAGTVTDFRVRRLTEMGMIPRHIRELRTQLATPALRIAKRWTELGLAPRLAVELVAQAGGRVVGPAGELLPAFFAVNGVIPQWTDPNSGINPVAPPKLFAPSEAGFTTGYPQVSIGSSNFAPNISKVIDALYDGRTQVRPDPTNINSYLPAGNNFEFGEAVFPRAYTFKGGRNTVLRNVNIGSYKQTFDKAGGRFLIEAFVFNGNVPGDVIFANDEGSVFTASIASNGNGTSTMTISGMASGSPSIVAGARIRDGAATGAIIQPFGTAGTTGTGTSGTYIINGEYTQASTSGIRAYSDNRGSYQAQGGIALDLRGANRNTFVIAGDGTSGYNNQTISSISMTGSNQVTIVLSGAFAGFQPASGSSISIWGVTTSGAGSPAPHNEGFNQSATVVSYNAGTNTIVANLDSFARNKPASGVTGSGGTVNARSLVNGEHADPWQGSGFLTKIGMYMMTIRGNYNQTMIGSTGLGSPDYPMEAFNIDGAFDETLNPQDDSTEGGRWGTTAIQASPRTLYNVFVAPRAGQTLNFFPTPADGGIATTALVNGVPVPAQTWDKTLRPNFFGLVYASTSPYRFGRMGMSSDHNGINAVVKGYSEDRIPIAADIGAVAFTDASGAVQTAINLVNSLEDNALIGVLDAVLTGLPPGSYVTDLFVSGGAGLSKRFRSISRELRRGSAMLPLGSFPNGLNAIIELRCIMKVTISGTTMTVIDNFYGRLEDGAEIMGPGITPGTTVISGAATNLGRAGDYQISNTHTIAAPITIRARSTVRQTVAFNVNVTQGTFAAFSGAFTRTFEGNVAATNTSGNTWTAVQALTAAPATDRVVVARIASKSSVSRGSSPTVTIGGIAATRICGVEANSAGSGWAQHCVYQALVPTGTVGDVTVNYGGTMQAVGAAVDSIVGGLRSAATGLLMVVDSATATAGLNVGASLQVNQAAGGVTLAGMYFSSAASNGRAEHWAGSVTGTSAADNVTVSTVIGGTTAAPTVTPTGAAGDTTAIRELGTSLTGATAMCAASFSPHI